MPASYTCGQPSNPRRHPTCCTSPQWSHTVSSMPCCGAWTSASLGAHPSIECERTAPQIETPICTRRTTSHQFIWQQQQQHTCGALGGLPMECGVDGQPHKTPHFHPRHRHPYSCNRSATRGTNAPPPKISKHCIEILTFLKLSKNKQEILYSNQF